MHSRFTYPLWNMSEFDKLFEIINSMMPLKGVSFGICLKCIQDTSLFCYRSYRKLHLTTVSCRKQLKLSSSICTSHFYNFKAFLNILST